MIGLSSIRKPALRLRPLSLTVVCATVSACVADDPDRVAPSLQGTAHALEKEIKKGTIKKEVNTATTASPHTRRTDGQVCADDPVRVLGGAAGAPALGGRAQAPPHPQQRRHRYVPDTYP